MARPLTPQQLQFAHHVAAGMPPSKAYAAAGYSQRGRHVANLPGRLMRAPHIKAKISELRALYAKQHETTAHSLVAELEYGRNEAAEAGNWGAYVKAIELKAKLLGLLVDKVEDVTQRRPVLIPTKQVELSADEWHRMVGLGQAPKTNGHGGNGQAH